jgi:acetyl esterase/lipase
MMRVAQKTIAGTAVLAAILLADGHPRAHESPVRHAHAGSTMAPDSESYDAIWYQDIPYASVPGVDPILLSLDIYTLDPASSAAPVMVYVHGGGGRRGDKAWANDIAAKPAFFIKGEGFVFVSVNYRIGDAGRYPTSQQDVADAVAWVHDHIGTYGGDPNRLFLMGHSSGAAIVARLATIELFLDRAGKDPSIVKGAITIDGGNFDVLADADTAQGRERLAAAYGPGRSDWEAASPLHHASKSGYVPPLLLLHIGNGRGSEQDANAMAAAMRAAGHRADVVALPGKDHFSASSDIGRYDDPSTRAVHAFLESIAGSSAARAAR